MFQYQTQVNGGWVTLSRDTYRYFQHTAHRRRFVPFVWLREVYKKIMFKIKEIRS